ncbi:MAG: glycoside hydrolase family 127 protein, partial [Verrucomicrobia bacterium]|nr:glycoside hydrolase family 127 protein [Verrucomicrobiota bacterium]
KGDTYFYTNPLEANKKRARWSWSGCPCCPPMFLKITGAMPGYVYAQDATGVYVNLFVGSRAEVRLPSGKVALQQTTRYPWHGEVKIAVEPERPSQFDLHVRIPAWSQGASTPDDLYRVAGRPVSGAARLKINGQLVEQPEMVRGYARLRREWKPGDVLELTLDMPVRRVKAHPKVTADADRVAFMRGPIVYCVESCDNDGNIRNIFVPPSAGFSAEHRDELLGGVTVLRGGAVAVYRAANSNLEQKPVQLTAVPYAVNANRGPVEMAVWLPETAALAQAQPLPTIASRARPSASYCCPRDSAGAMNDQIEPAASDDTKIPRFTWWNHCGTKEWAQYDFDQPQKVSSVEVYWWDERRIKHHCRVPESWRLLYKEGNEWKPVSGASEFDTKMDQFNRVTFTPVTTTALRIEVQLQPNWSGGILEWKVE